MQFDLISDVHIDDKNLNDAFLKSVIPCKSKILIIAGDVSRTTDESWPKYVSFLAVCCSRYDMVYYVLGNQEYYCINPSQIISMDVIFRKIVDLEKIYGNLKILNNEVDILDKYKLVIFGSTFWSEVEEKYFPSNIPIYKFSDAYLINKNITYEEWMSLYFESRVALQKAIDISKYLGYKLLVVTHYSPVFNEALNPKYFGDKKNMLYCSDLSKYFDSVDVWVFGHTGWNCDIKKYTSDVKTIRLVTNQYEIKSGKKFLDAPIFL